MSKRTVSVRLTPQIETFRKEQYFCDAIIVSGNDRFECHRILLARHCQWFLREFLAHPPEGMEPTTITIPVNPSGIFSTFLNVLYTGEVTVDVYNLPLLLKMSVFYESPEFTAIFRYFLKRAATEQTFLHFARILSELDLVEDALSLAPADAKEATPFLAEHYSNYLKWSRRQPWELKGVKRPPVTIDDIYDAVSAPVLAGILKQILDDPRKFAPLTEAEVVAMIDRFYETHPSDRESDKESLAKLINWESISSWRYIVKHKCDWIPARIYRTLVTEALKKRKAVLKKLEKNTESIQTSVNRWYAFSWIQAVRDALVPLGRSPSVKVVELMTTLGGTTDFVDPLLCGFLEVVETVHAIAPQFSADQWFNKGKYWMARQSESVLPVFGFNLKGAWFIPETVFVDTVATYHGSFSDTGKSDTSKQNSSVRDIRNDQTDRVEQFRHAPKPVGTSVSFVAGDNLEDFQRGKRTAIEIQLTGGKAAREIGKREIEPKTVLGLEFNAPSSVGFNIARLSEFDLSGQFVCSSSHK